MIKCGAEEPGIGFYTDVYCSYYEGKSDWFKTAGKSFEKQKLSRSEVNFDEGEVNKEGLDRLKTLCTSNMGNSKFFKFSATRVLIDENEREVQVQEMVVE